MCSPFSASSVIGSPVCCCGLSTLAALNVALAERTRAGDEAPSSSCQVQRHLRRRKEAVQQHLHVSHVACRLTDLGQLLKRDQGSRESLPNDKFVTARHRSQTGIA